MEADLNYVEVAMNTIALPALTELGFVPSGLLFRFREQEDTTQLFSQTIQAAQYFDIDPQWVREKFGIEVLGPRQIGGLSPDSSDLSDEEDKDKKPKRKEENSYSTDYDPFV